MKKKNESKYKISGNRVTHLKLNNIKINENESLSMLDRYDFDEETIRNIIVQIDLDMQKLKLEQEQKEYEEMNYISLYKRMNRYSIGELLGQLIQGILCALSMLVKNRQED